MSTISQRYKSSKLTTVALSTGDEIKVRRFGQLDALFLGTMPLVLFSEESREVLNGPDEQAKAEHIRKNADAYTALLNHVITNCVVSPGWNAVAKPAKDCSDDELPVELIDQADQVAILSAALGGAAPQASKFRSEQDVVGQSGQVGDEVRGTPVTADKTQSA